jgi:hypothetical protein
MTNQSHVAPRHRKRSTGARAARDTPHCTPMRQHLRWRPGIAQRWCIRAEMQRRRGLHRAAETGGMLGKGG